MPPIAHIGGSGTWEVDFARDLGELGVELVGEEVVETPWGKTAPIRALTLDGVDVLQVSFHGYHSDDTERDARALFWALQERSVRNIVADGSVGSLNRLLDPQDVVVPDDFIDARGARPRSAHQATEMIQADPPFDPAMRAILINEARERFRRVFPRGVTLCTGGTRYESHAEVRMYAAWGGDVVGTTVCPEVELAASIGARFAVINVVSNYGSGLQAAWTDESLAATYHSFQRPMAETIIGALKSIAAADDAAEGPAA